MGAADGAGPSGKAAEVEEAEGEEEEASEEVLWRCEEAYVYQLPRALNSSHGHRADDWDVDNWLKAVRVTVAARGDRASVRMSDRETGELFASVPVPVDRPLSTAVEPVIDSSRYYVVRVVDEASGRHAFLGFGFRQREESSAFTACLDDHMKYLRRRREAAAMRERFEEEEAHRGRAGGEGPAAPDRFGLKEGEKITISVGAAPASASAPGGGGGGLAGRLQRMKLARSGAGPPATAGGFLPPPPAMAVTPPPAARAAAAEDDDEDDFGDFQS